MSESGMDRSFSQDGEDLRIAELLGPDHPRWVVDVGANDGQSWSNSRYFGLRGYELFLIEPMPEYAAKCRTLYAGRHPPIRVEQAAINEQPGEAEFFINEDAEADLLAMRSSLDRGSVPGGRTRMETVPVRRLDALLEAHNWPCDYALLSVDAEGFDLQVLRSAGLERWRPRVVCVEDEVLGDACALYLSRFGYSADVRRGANGLYRRNG